jgi:hypothetical protein
MSGDRQEEVAKNLMVPADQGVSSALQEALGGFQDFFKKDRQSQITVADATVCDKSGTCTTTTDSDAADMKRANPGGITVKHIPGTPYN